MEKSILLCGGDVPVLAAALALARASVPVCIVTDRDIIGSPEETGTDDAIAPARPVLPLELEVAGNRHVKIFLRSRITSLSRHSRGCSVHMEKYPSYIDEERCSGCGRCEEVCPVKYLGRKAITSHGKQYVPSSYAIQRSSEPPCVNACPAGVNAQGYIALIRAGKFKEALELEREKNPFAAVCGRVCHRPCESQCERQFVDAPVSIRDLKRFIADYSPPQTAMRRFPKKITLPARPGKASSMTVAIIGAGPAGLTCARTLENLGYNVTLFEQSNSLGGMLSWAIPAFRLPRSALKQDLDNLLAPAIKVQTGAALGRDYSIESLRRDGFRAVFIAIGAQKGIDLKLCGNHGVGRIMNALQFLKRVEDEGHVEVGSTVLVIGGGNAAVDAARTAIRCGARDVSLVYRRTRREMPAITEEVLEAEKEGVRLFELSSPLQYISEEGILRGLKVGKNRLGDPDDSGRCIPVPIPGREEVMACDTIITALGQMVDSSSLAGSGIELTRAGTIIVDSRSLSTGIPGVFAGGDAVTGAATVIEAIAAGSRAAESIDCHIRGIPLPDRPFCIATTEERRAELMRRAIPHARNHAPAILPQKRIMSFEEVEGCFSFEEALREAERCLNCGDCSLCGECQKACIGPRAVIHSQKLQHIDLDVKAVISTEGLNPSGEMENEASSALRKMLLYLDLPLRLEAQSDEVCAEIFHTVAAAGKNIVTSPRILLKDRACEDCESPGGEHRMGVYLCRCGAEASGEKEWEALSTMQGLWKEVKTVEECTSLCSDDTLRHISEEAERNGLSHLVLGCCACCSLPRICEGCSWDRIRVKRRVFSALGHMKLQIEFFNVRELWAQCTGAEDRRRFWKLRCLIGMALERARSGRMPPAGSSAGEQRVLITVACGSAVPLALSFKRVGFDTVVWNRGNFLTVEEKEYLASRGIDVPDRRLHSINWSSDRAFEVSWRGEAELQTEKYGAIVSDGFPEEVHPFITQVYKHNNGYFPGLFIIDGISSLPPSLSEDLPGFLSAVIASHLVSTEELHQLLLIWRDDLLCRECGKCALLCPHGGFETSETGSDSSIPIRHNELCHHCGICTSVCDTSSLKAAPLAMQHFERLLDTILGE